MFCWLKAGTMRENNRHGMAMFCGVRGAPVSIFPSYDIRQDTHKRYLPRSLRRLNGEQVRLGQSKTRTHNAKPVGALALESRRHCKRTHSRSNEWANRYPYEGPCREHFG